MPLLGSPSQLCVPTSQKHENPRLQRNKLREGTRFLPSSKQDSTDQGSSAARPRLEKLILIVLLAYGVYIYDRLVLLMNSILFFIFIRSGIYKYTIINHQTPHV